MASQTQARFRMAWWRHSRHSRHRVLSLKAVTNMAYSAFTLFMPRNVNCWAPNWFLRKAKSGSTNAKRRRYTRWVSSVAIHAR